MYLFYGSNDYGSPEAGFIGDLVERLASIFINKYPIVF